MDKCVNFELMETVLDNYYGTILVMDKDEIIVYVNKNLLNLFDIEKSDIIGKEMSEMIEVGVFSRSISTEALRTKKICSTFCRFSKRTKTDPIMAIAIPVFDETGEVEYVTTFTLFEPFVNDLVKKIDSDKEKHLQLLDYFNVSDQKSMKLITRNPKMQKLVAYAGKIAKSDSTVVLYGESGTGKEVVSRFIHKQSSRAEKIFLPINCATIPAELMESEFFGYVKGAFTGANKEGKIGYFELANKGTLFLDEIGELPLAIQSKLLRVLETGEIMKVGSNKIQCVDIRIIAATNRNLEKMVKEGTFREDLYYRLNVIPITIPPIRERPEDILPLATFFLEEYNKKYGYSKIFSKETIKYYTDYSWPGNVREIRNVVERMVIASNTDVLNVTFDSMALGLRPKLNATNGCELPEEKEKPPEIDCSKPLKEAMAEFERKYIKAVMSKCNQNVNLAAKKLNIHKSGLYKKIEIIKALENNR